MADRSFSLAYLGPAVDDGRMDIRTLAPALIALADLFRDANAVLNPELPPVRLEIRATRPGSFDVHLILSQKDLVAELVKMFSGTQATALANLLQIVIGGGGTVLSLFHTVMAIRGRSVQREEDTGSAMRLVLSDGTTFEVSPETAALYRSVTIRRHLREVVAPLATEGVEQMEFRSEDLVTVRVEHADWPAFEVPAGATSALPEHETELYLSVVSVAFQEGNKWRVSDGQNQFWASIEDQQFMERVLSGRVAFRSGDVLRTRVRIRQEQDSEGSLHADYAIEKVLEHRAGRSSRQLPLIEP